MTELEKEIFPNFSKVKQIAFEVGMYIGLFMKYFRFVFPIA